MSLWAAHPTKNGGTPVASDSRPSAPTSGSLNTAHSATPDASLAAARSTSVLSLASAPSSSSSSASSPSPAAAPLRARVRQGQSFCAASTSSVAPDSGQFPRARAGLLSKLSTSTTQAARGAPRSRAPSEAAGRSGLARAAASRPRELCNGLLQHVVCVARRPGPATQRRPYLGRMQAAHPPAARPAAGAGSSRKACGSARAPAAPAAGAHGAARRRPTAPPPPRAALRCSRTHRAGSRAGVKARPQSPTWHVRAAA